MEVLFIANVSILFSYQILIYIFFINYSFNVLRLYLTTCISGQYLMFQNISCFKPVYDKKSQIFVLLNLYYMKKDE